MKEANMAYYVMFTTLTDEGRKAVRDEPERLKEINKEVELLGIKLLSQYAVLGPYDFINIVEAPSDEAAAKLAIYLSARGTMQTTTYPAMTVDKLISILQKKPSPF